MHFYVPECHMRVKLYFITTPALNKVMQVEQDWRPSWHWGQPRGLHSENQDTNMSETQGISQPHQVQGLLWGHRTYLSVTFKLPHLLSEHGLKCGKEFCSEIVEISSERVAAEFEFPIHLFAWRGQGVTF